MTRDSDKASNRERGLEVRLGETQARPQVGKATLDPTPFVARDSGSAVQLPGAPSAPWEDNGDDESSSSLGKRVRYESF
jgi:hypothetical protein